MDTNPGLTPDDCADELDAGLEAARVDRGELEGAAVASVVRGVAEILAQAVLSRWGVTAVEVGADADVGIQVGVPNPGAVGIDRLLASAEGYRTCGGATVTVGCGTAVTVDAVSSQGCYLGGAILPGLQTALDCLHARTSLLPRVRVTAPAGPLGQSTTECLLAGTVYGTAGGVEKLIRAEREAMDEEAAVVLTGGDAPLLSPFVRVEHRVEPDLALRGLGWTYMHRAG